MRLDIILKAIHVTANVFWVGAIVAVAMVILADVGDPKTRGSIAHRIYLRLAVPSFVISFLAGVGRLSLDASLYMKQGWFHAKLLFVLIVIALHHVIGGKAKRMAKGEADDPGKTGALAIAMAVAAALAAFVAVWRFGK